MQEHYAIHQSENLVPVTALGTCSPPSAHARRLTATYGYFTSWRFSSRADDQRVHDAQACMTFPRLMDVGVRCYSLSQGTLRRYGNTVVDVTVNHLLAYYLVYDMMQAEGCESPVMNRASLLFVCTRDYY